MRFEKKDTKFKNIYGLFVVVLAFAVIAGLIWIWIACDKYQKHSASTMVRTEIERLSEELGVELSCDMVPKKSEDGSLGYTLKNGNVKTARVYLVQDGNGIMNLAMYRIAGTEGLLEFSFVAEEGCSVCAGETELQFTAEPFVFKGTEEINAERFGLPKFCIYTVSGLLSTDNISVSKDAEVLSMTGIQDELSFASKRFDAQTAETIRKRVNTFNQTYAYYLSKHISLGEVKS